MTVDLTNWKGCPRPERRVFEGRYIRVEPLSAERHGDDLYEISSGPTGEARFKYLWENVESRDNFQKWLCEMEKASDPIMYVLINKQTGKAEGRQSFWNIDEANGVVEFGHTLRAITLDGKPGSVEAIYLPFRYVFEELGYRRITVRTHHHNYASQKSILRFGMQLEGVLRQHGVKKGENQDSYIFSLLDREWPFQKRIVEIWLDPNNFDSNGKPKLRIDEVRTSILSKITADQESFLKHTSIVYNC